MTHTRAATRPSGVGWPHFLLCLFFIQIMYSEYITLKATVCMFISGTVLVALFAQSKWAILWFILLHIGLFIGLASVTATKWAIYLFSVFRGFFRSFLWW